MHHHSRFDRKDRTWQFWLHWGKKSCLNLEFVWFTSLLSMYLGLADYESALRFSCYLKLFGFSISFDHYPLYQKIRDAVKRKDEQFGNGRTIGWSWYDGSLSIDLWCDMMEHRRADPRWWHFYIEPRNVIFGRPQYSDKTIRTVRVEIPMPEGCYPATVRFFESTWKRPRWPWSRKLVRADIKPDTPIPHPGKGENSWDCDEDSTHSMTTAEETELGAVMAMVESVLRSRYRHGGLSWRPKLKVVKQ